MKQWTEEEWKEFESRLEDADTQNEVNRLIDLTHSQAEHPEWYDSPCHCQICCNYHT